MNDAPLVLYCKNHTSVETTLKCNRCEQPICPKCALSTPTGYRCKECVKGQQRIFETATMGDYAISGIISGILAFIGSLLVPALGFFAIFLSPITGTIIAEIIRAITKKRRSKRLFQLIVYTTLAGCIPVLLYSLVMFIVAFSQGSIASFWSLLWKGVYTFVVTSTVYYRLAGIRINV
jgi:hypothetical protein